MKRTILLLEDDLQLSDTLKQFFQYQGYKVLCAYDGNHVEELSYENTIDLMLLDIKVPFQNGFEFLRSQRSKKIDTPAIFISSLNSVDDVAHGFDIGCDDYLRKPFSLKELKVRVEALMKRRYGSYDEKIELGDGLVFSIKENNLTHHKEKIPLKNKEAKLLCLFLKHPNELLTYDTIFSQLWSYDEVPSAGSLRAYVQTLRNALGKEMIETIKNAGYRFVKK